MSTTKATKLLSKTAINYHFTRKCNYECSFCFHTKKTSYLLDNDKQYNLLKLLREHGAEKINFAGGEPFLFPEVLGNLVEKSKELNYSSISIISNASRIKRDWFEKYSKSLDIMGVSCDSINPEVNFKQGRKIAGSYKPIDDSKNITKVADLCREFGVKFKINTVVTELNKKEDLSDFINKVNPIRWKVFQVLDVEGENYTLNNKESINKLKSLLISNEDFENYLSRNLNGLKNKNILKPELNDLMRNSYIIVDEYGRFLDCGNGSKNPTESILDVGVEEAFNQLNGMQTKGFDYEKFIKRGGYYPEEWAKCQKI